MVLAFDHRWQLEEVASTYSAVDRLPELKKFIYEAFVEVRGDRSDTGILVDAAYGGEVLERASGTGIWIGRALDVPRSHPLQLEGGTELAAFLRSWPRDHIAKVMVYGHPADPQQLMAAQLSELVRLDRACLIAEREFLIELQPSPGRNYDGGDVAKMIDQIYTEGIRPAWWKLPPNGDAAVWKRIGDVVRRHDRDLRGILILGQLASPPELRTAFEACASEPLCRGFAVGRGIFALAAQDWLAGEESDRGLVRRVAERFRWSIETWEATHAQDREVNSNVD